MAHEFPSFTLVVKNTFLEVVEGKETHRHATNTRRRSHGDLGTDVASVSDCGASTAPPSTAADGSDSICPDVFGMSLRGEGSSDHPSSDDECSPSPGHAQGSPGSSDHLAAAVPPEPTKQVSTSPCFSARPCAAVAQCLSTTPKASQPRTPKAVTSTLAIWPSKPCPQDVTRPAELETRTTVMLKNLPARMDRSSLMKLLKSHGFRGCYDFMYLPMNFSTGSNLGYGFLNFVSPLHAERCFRHFDGFMLPLATEFGSSVPSCTTEAWRCSWSEIQGLKQHVEKYRSCPVMHPSIPDEWKPITLSKGFRVAFPPPMQEIKAPRPNRLRGHKPAACTPATAREDWHKPMAR